jgi:transcription elongation factor Elf1
MSCDICGSSSCVSSFHSFEEQERYEKVIEAFDHARSLREQIREDSELEE